MTADNSLLSSALVVNIGWRGISNLNKKCKLHRRKIKCLFLHVEKEGKLFKRKVILKDTNVNFREIYLYENWR